MTTMQRWELSAFGRENLSLVSVPRPVPGADEVLVEVEAVSLNFRDSLIMDLASSPLSPRFFPTLKTNRSNGLDTRVKRQGSLKVTYPSV
jgi:NADPH:quinone reductase-like Zn-dependent oxidoreductase